MFLASASSNLGLRLGERGNLRIDVVVCALMLECVLKCIEGVCMFVYERTGIRFALHSGRILQLWRTRVSFFGVVVQFYRFDAFFCVLNISQIDGKNCLP